MKRTYNSNLAFIDLLFNLILGFVFLFIISFILINDPVKNEGVEQKAEFMIILSWDAKANKDIDLWIDGPTGHVGFTTPQQGNMFLDRDDLGHRNDTYLENSVRKVVHINREVVNIRGIVPGEYVVNAFYYSNGDEDIKTDVSIEVIKLNPYIQIYQGSKLFDYRSQEETFVRFTIDSVGNILKLNYLPKDIVRKKTSIMSGAEQQIFSRP